MDNAAEHTPGSSSASPKVQGGCSLTGRPPDRGLLTTAPPPRPVMRGGKRARTTIIYCDRTGISNVPETPIQPQPKRRRKAQINRQPRLPTAHAAQPLPTEQLKLPHGGVCVKCNAQKFAYETPFFCCANGAIQLPTNAYPPTLVRLYTSPDEDAVHFRAYARMYNNLFAFSSIGGNYAASTLKGIYVFTLHGQIYHHVPTLLPNDGRPKYLQLYFYDGRHEALNRTGCFPEVRGDIINTLMQITQSNPYARFFRSLKELPIDENTQIKLNRNTVLDQRVYNAPTSDEVAVIWTESSSSSESSTPHITVTAKDNKSHRIMHYYGCYDPLQHPLLFPSGECGWVQGLRKVTPGTTQIESHAPDRASLELTQTVEGLLEDELNRAEQGYGPKDKIISCRQYYCYKLQNRPGNMLLRTGRCFQQYVVDMYVKIENTRLDYFRNNQETIRAELYQGIIDTVGTGECRASNVGKRVILPPTFLGGPRDMKKRYLNSMALVHRFGKPDLFVTMTCNPTWPEIKNHLAPREEAHNRPDLVARVFRAKLLALKKQIVEKHIFGEVAAYVYVVEFQKRGLPHVHFLIILKDGYRLKCPADFDKFVCAEIPSMANPALRKTVLKHMMHGPCGKLNPACSCMKHANSPGCCKYEYPKSYTADRTVNGAGYPEYRRRNTGEKVLIRDHELDNKWVIPYNPYLLALFDCHLNVEVCSTMHAVKYLYKYIYEGHDKISFSVTDAEEPTTIDEIAQFQSGRWVSPCEAAWRIFGFDLFETYPPVMPLQVHLPNMQTIRLRSTDNLADVIADEKRSRTPLTEFFKKSATKDCPKLLYGEFTEHYRWDTGTRTWEKKEKQSYCDWQEAALRHRLLEEEDAAELCMAEACAVQMPTALRRLFSTLLIFAQPKDPYLLWDTHYESLSDDFRLKFPADPRKVSQLTARSVERYLEAMGKTMAEFGLEHLDTCNDDEMRRTRDIVDALDAAIPEDCTLCKALLNSAQKEAFDTIMEHVRMSKPGAFFVDGPGGTDKTFLYKALYAEVRLMGQIVLPTASSGIAAANIPGGRTTHSQFKIPLECDISLAWDIPKQSSLAALIRATTLIIWDEASMSKRQTLPILPIKSQREVLEASLFSSHLWPKLTKFSLSENLRARDDPEFARFLLALGNGELQTKEYENIELPDGLVRVLDSDDPNPISGLAALAFPELDLGTFDPDIFTNRAILTPLNDDVDAINDALIDKFPGKAVTYTSHDSMLDDTCAVYPAEFINKLNPGGMSPHKLILKENCPVILIRNLQPSFGLCNGTRLICKRFLPNTIECVIMTGQHKGDCVLIPRIKLQPAPSANYPFQFQRNQFPLKLSFAMSINKCRTTNTLQGESHWLHVKLNDFSIYDVHLYLGCSLCGAGSVQEEGLHIFVLHV
ncbi:uncharacterized protein LOC141654817 [Silene latifolia]|uniref:uncharacterized protein LOC141654817 n=1 Tax=Silene latifolia TaxID=37657 RepID=UPI003D779B3C